MPDKKHELLPLEPYDPYKPPGTQGLQRWNVEGRMLDSTVEPQPTLKNPGRYWTQDEENVWREVDPRDFPQAEPRLSDIMDTKDQILGGEPAGPSMTEEEKRKIIEGMAPRISDILGRHLSGEPQ